MKKKFFLAAFALTVFVSAVAQADPPVPVCQTYTCSDSNS